MPPLFLPFIIDIISHSFTDDQDDYDRFLSVLKAGCLKYYELLLSKTFTNLLQSLSDETKDVSSLYFGSLNQSCLILDRAFKLLQERKVLLFDQGTIDGLVKGGVESFAIMSSRPRVLNSESVDAMRKTV